MLHISMLVTMNTKLSCLCSFRNVCRASFSLVLLQLFTLLAQYSVVAFVPPGTVPRYNNCRNDDDVVVVDNRCTIRSCSTPTVVTDEEKEDCDILSQTAAKEQRSKIAKTTWETIALSATPSNRDVTINLKDDDNDDYAVTVHDEELFTDFLSSITGTYFINGLASCQVGNRLLHPFEAHGYVKSLILDGTTLRLQTRIVETTVTKYERMFNTPLARGVMSQLGNPLWNALAPTERNTANLMVTMWPPPNTLNNDRNNSNKQSVDGEDPVLIVGGDNGEPYMVDPETLETRGKLSDQVPALRGKKMLAHTRIDQRRQRLVLCSSTFDVSDRTTGERTEIEFVEFDIHWNVVACRIYKTRFMVFHDWVLTDHYYVVPKNPATFKWENLPQFLLGLRIGTDVFEMDYGSVGEMILIPRHDTNAKAIECAAKNFFQVFHFGPCFEESTSEDGLASTVTIYGSVFDQYRFGGEMGFNVANQEFDPIKWSSNPEIPAPRLDKFKIDIKAEAIIERQRIPLMDKVTGLDVPVDMPTWNNKDGTNHQYCYFVGAERPEGWFPFRSIVKADLVTGTIINWDAGDDSICSEPMYLPRRSAHAEDDGFVVSIVHNSNQTHCELVVFDSQRFDQGPIATINLGELMPWCVHGCWVPDYVPRERSTI